MNIELSEKEIESVVVLSPDKRYKYFLNKVADTGFVWGLYEDGWALAGDIENRQLIPLWPTKEYAMLCAKDIWKNYRPKSIEIHEFLDDLMKDLELANISLAVFYTPEDRGVIVKYENFSHDMLRELAKIE